MGAGDDKKVWPCSGFALKRLIKDTGILLGYLPYDKDVWEPETIEKFGRAVAFTLRHLLMLVCSVGQCNVSENDLERAGVIKMDKIC